jgi:hypothetical protein
LLNLKLVLVEEAVLAKVVEATVGDITPTETAR